MNRVKRRVPTSSSPLRKDISSTKCSSGIWNYFSLNGKTFKGCKDTSEILGASRCITQGNHKSQAKDGVAYGVVQVAPIDDISATDRNGFITTMTR